MAYQPPVPVTDVLRAIHDRSYVLPAIQREFEWSTDQIRRLFDSLIRGYPIGSFLFWHVLPPVASKFRFYDFLTDYHERKQPYAPQVTIPAGQGVTAKVLDIFVRVNSAGTRLSHSDILMSMATNQWTALDARKEVRSLVDELNGGQFNFTKDLVLKAGLVLIDVSDVRFKVTNFTQENTALMEERWLELRTALFYARSLLRSFGFATQTLAANSVLIPVAYYIHWYDLGVTLSRLKQRKKAQSSFLKTLRLDPKQAGAHYDLACLDALEHKPKAAFENLEKAVAHGFRNVRHLRRDADLRSLRKDARWKAIAARIDKLAKGD